MAEVDDARALAAEGIAFAGERENVLIEGFDFGNSPREFLEPPAHSTLVMTTTNGTRLLLSAAARCETVLVASLLNLDAVVDAARESRADEVAVLCAGVEGAFAIDDAYVAGRIVQALGGEPDDAAIAAIQLAGSFATAEEGIGGGIERRQHPPRAARRGHCVVRPRERPRHRAVDRRARAGLGRGRGSVGGERYRAAPHGAEAPPRRSAATGASTSR